MDIKRDGPSQDSYRVISFKGSELPASYRPMVFSKFLRSLRYGNEYFKLIEQEAYFSVYHQFIEALLSRSDSQVRLAVLTDNPDVVLGWALIEPNVLHYCYVNRENRRLGIGRALWAQPFTTCTHMTNMGASIWASKLKHVSFNPFR